MGRQLRPQEGLWNEWDKAHTVFSAVPGSVNAAIHMTSLDGQAMFVIFQQVSLSEGECPVFRRRLLFPTPPLITSQNNVTFPTCWSLFSLQNAIWPLKMLLFPFSTGYLKYQLYGRFTRLPYILTYPILVIPILVLCVCVCVVALTQILHCFNVIL